MGLGTSSVQFLCAARSFHVDFTRTLMLGRQSFTPDVAALRRVFSVLGVNQNAEQFLRDNKYSEPFFTLLGAREITALDYSSYEGAGILHDMNLPIPGELRGRFSVVHDGGTIEHVFNIPQALKNCMEMVEVGGHFTQVNVANNCMGHGFWQFSPEMIFRVFSPANGFQIESVLLHEEVPHGGWWLVTDPDQIRARVELCNSAPTYIFTLAKRVALADIFARTPQQSDYVVAWDRVANMPASDKAKQDFRSLEASDRKLTGQLRRIAGWAKRGMKRSLQRLSPFAANRGGFGQSCYRPITEDALLHGRLK